MSKKTWIKIKRGLLDPKHRAKFGEKSKIWLYLHMLDRANWDDGIVYDWRDKDEADDMAMNWRTLQDHRQGLEAEGYIVCHFMGDHQEIEIKNWINPREYSGTVYNKDTEETAPQENGKGTVKGTVEVYAQPRTPTLYSQVTNQLTQKEAYAIFEPLFSEASNISIPDDWPVRQKRWRSPIWRMYKSTEFDAGKTGDIIKQTVKQMRKDKLTLSAPASIEKVFTDLYAQSKTQKKELDYA